MSSIYHVETVALDRIDPSAPVTITVIGDYPTIEAAMIAAKRAARTRRDCCRYGPSSIAYVGRTVTAMVAW